LSTRSHAAPNGRSADMTNEAAASVVELALRIGHEFADPTLLRRALAHRSFCAEVVGERSNERLEYLGDAVLGWVVADVVYRRFPDLDEGRLTDLRKSVVNAAALADVARGLDLGGHLLLGRGEDAAGGRDKASILSDALEAVIGAVYLDGGAAAAHGLVERLIGPYLVDAGGSGSRADHKTRLQELTARMFDTAPAYVVRSEGPDHELRFFATVFVGGRPFGEGEGSSKKLAEQAAAAEAVARLLEGPNAPRTA
jgi:ribonuclease III